MSITQAESGLSSGAYNKLLAATADIPAQFIVYRQNPSFDTYLGRISRDLTTPYSVAADSSIVVRAYIDQSNSHLYAEVWNGASWSAPVSVATSQMSGIAPKIVKDGSTWKIYSIHSTSYVYLAASSDGITWGSSAAYSTVLLTTPTFLTAALGSTPLVYVASKNSNDSFSIKAINATTQFDLGLTWANTIYDMDAVDFQVKEDDTTGTHSNTGERHCLVMSCLLPSSYAYKTVADVPVKQAVPAGGLLSVIIRPPAGSRPAQTSYWYPIHIFDQWDSSIQSRTSARIMTTNSIFDSSNARDTLWVTSVGFEGDRNDVDTSYGYHVASYYASRDGKHWSQSQIIPLDVDTDGDGDFSGGASIVKSSDKLYLVTPTALVKSGGCLEFYNTPTSLTMDLTKRVISYSSSVNAARSSDIVLDNRDGLLWTSFFVNPGVYTIITKLGGVQVSVEEIDSVGPEVRSNSSSLTENIQITTRDRLAWITDRIESVQAEQWDHQLAALDTFTDINGTTDSGLAHTDTVKGVFGTTNNKLIGKAKYRENIGFHTTGSGHVQDGHGAAIFEMPTPISFGGTSAADSPTYIGVLFRALDKDNFWAAWYNYWTGKIELVERSGGIDTIQASFTPTSAFTTRANAANTVGIRVEFKGATVKIYESTILYSAIGARYNPTYTYTVAKTSKSLLMGYVGYISSAYSDEDQGDVTDPGPIITIEAPTSWGAMDSFKPSRYYSLDWEGYFFYGSGSLGSPSWTDLSPSGAIQTALAGSAPLRGGSPTNQWDFIVDPFHLHRMIMFGYGGLAINDSVHTNSWTLSSHTPLMGGYWCFFHQFPDFGVSGDIVASINWEGYFGWIEYNSPCYYVYTYDNFATIHRTAISGGNPHSISISQRATNWTNIYVVIAGYGGALQESTDGGQTFTNKTLPSPIGSIYSESFYGVNVPYSLGGGAANTTNKVVTFYSNDHSGNSGFYDLSGTWRSFATIGTNGGRSRNINTLTVDGNYINIRNDGWVHRSSNGGASWTLAATGGDSGFPYFGSRLNGWPTNPDIGIMPDRLPTITLDGFATTFSINPGGRGAHISNLVADLTERYDIGGVHG